MTQQKSALINVMIGAAEKVGRALLRDFGEIEQLQVSRKGPADFVTQADIKADRLLRDELKRVRPSFGLITEEGEPVAGERGMPDWVVDPIDGTLNFLHGLPHWAISIGVVQAGEAIAGVVHDPIKAETFWGEKGAGAYLNNKRLRVSGRRDLAEALIGTGIPFVGRGDHAAYLKELGAVMGATAGVRRAGSAALDLAYVAAGRLDAFWEHGLKIWDIAGGLAILREAGGIVLPVGVGGAPLSTGNVLAGNAEIAGALARLLRDAGS